MTTQPNAIPLAKMSDINAHTPGPWFSHGRYIGTKNHKSFVGECRDVNGNWTDEGMASANARLIAAAPDLLAALQKVDADWAETFPDGPDGDRDWHGLGKLSDETAEVWRSIRAAIARATTP